MEEDGDGEDDLTPFWVQSTATNVRRGVSSIFFSSGLVVLLLLVTAVFFLVFVVPSTLSFRPNSVKKSWDSLNIVLVLVAVVFGFLSRNKNEERYSHYDEFNQASPSKQNESSQKSSPSTPNKWYNYSTNEGQKSNLSSSNQWYEYPDYYKSKLEHKNSTVRRNSNSYPDLREFSSSRWSYGNRRYYDDDDIHVDSDRVSVSDPRQLHRRHRSLEQVDNLRAPPPPPPQTKTVVVDDIHVDSGRVSVSDPRQLHRRHRSLEQVDNLRAPPQTKNVIVVDTLLSRSKDLETPLDTVTDESRNERSSRKPNKDSEPVNHIVTTSNPPHPPPPDPPQCQEDANRTYERAAARRKERSERKRNNRGTESTNPITPPPPQQSSSKSDNKRGGGATKDFLNSLYQKKKKKKQRHRSVDKLDSLLHEAQPPISFQVPPPSPPPPPPPPPPPSVFHNLFSSKKHKRKRTIIVTVETNPPEPTSQTTPLNPQKPPKPIAMNNKFEENSNSFSGGESPLNRIPPPPPPPPAAFYKKPPAWKFVVQGDYVRVNSDTDDADSDVTPSSVGDATPFHPSPLFCASPDVDTKAETFISSFRAKLKLEKIHSMKKREVGLSGLGPGPGPSQI